MLLYLHNTLNSFYCYPTLTVNTSPAVKMSWCAVKQHALKIIGILKVKFYAFIVLAHDGY